jgi:hypothetical protein
MAMLLGEMDLPFVSSECMLGNFQNIGKSEETDRDRWILCLLSTQSDEEHTLCHIETTIQLFDDAEKCVDFLTDIYDDNVCLILSTSLDKTLLPILHELPQLKCIYIVNHNVQSDRTWINGWTKIKGLSSDFNIVYDQFKQSVRKSEYDLASITITSSSTGDNVNELDSSFMYSQLLKDTVLKIQYDNKSKMDFVEYLRRRYASNPRALKTVLKFEQEYSPQSSIWWYSKEVFIYEPLNRALRTQDTDTLVRMGFFLQDLHHAIRRLYEEQQSKKRAFVFRGQAMAKIDFEKLQRLSINQHSRRCFTLTCGQLQSSKRFSWNPVSNRA